MTDDVRRDDPEQDPGVNPPHAESPPAAPPTVAWLAATAPGPPTDEQPRTPAQRLAEAAVWALGIGAVLFLGRVFVLFNPAFELSGFERGQVVGRIAGAVFLGAAVRWVWVKLRKRGRVLNPWILVVAALALGSSLTRDAATLIPPVGQPVETYLQIGSPYTLAVAPADVSTELNQRFGQGGSSATEVREVWEAGTPVGYLLVANVGTTAAGDFFAGAETGFERNPGTEAHLEVIGGAEVLVGTGPDFAAVIWKEPPYAIVLYSLDAESGKLLAAAVMAAYR